MGHRTTRPYATLRACRLRRYVAPFAVLAWLAGAPVLAQTGTAQVDRVIDGDTIRVRLDGARSTVRLTGVDTPETTHPTRGVEPYGPEAAEYTTARLTGATVRLVRVPAGATPTSTTTWTPPPRGRAPNSPKRRTHQMPHAEEITAATARSAKATKSLDTMRARILKADEARTDAAHEARAAQVAEAATEAATDNREAAEAWDALATHAAKQAGACRHGAALAERTRRRWPR